MQTIYNKTPKRKIIKVIFNILNEKFLCTFKCCGISMNFLSEDFRGFGVTFGKMQSKAGSFRYLKKNLA